MTADSRPVPDLTPLQIALWPSVRESLKRAHQSLQAPRALNAWAQARHCGLDEFARQDLGWQAEAFLEGSRAGPGEPPTPDNRVALRAAHFSQMGLDWERLAPVVFDDALINAQAWVSVPLASRGAEDSLHIRSWISCLAFLSCVGAGPIPSAQLSTHRATLRAQCRGIAQLDEPRRAQAARFLLGLKEDAAPRSDRVTNAELFGACFSNRPWDENCADWGNEADFTLALTRIRERADLSDAAAPANAARPARRV